MKKLLLAIVIFSCNNTQIKRGPVDYVPNEVATFDSLAEGNLSVRLMEYVDTSISYSMQSHKSLGVTYKTYHYDTSFKLHYLTEKMYADTMDRNSNRDEVNSFTVFQYHFKDDRLFKISQSEYKAGDLAGQTNYYIKNKIVFYKKGNQELDRKDVILKEMESSIFHEISKKYLNNATSHIRP
jgi:hypothetical protein